MSCNIGEESESLENELCSFFKLSISSPTSQLILQPFPRFTYITAHSPTLPLLHLRHSSFSNPSFASPTSQDFHLHHLASRPWKTLTTSPTHSHTLTHTLTLTLTHTLTHTHTHTHSHTHTHTHTHTSQIVPDRGPGLGMRNNEARLLKVSE